MTVNPRFEAVSVVTGKIGISMKFCLSSKIRKVKILPELFQLTCVCVYLCVGERECK